MRCRSMRNASSRATRRSISGQGGAGRAGLFWRRIVPVYERQQFADGGNFKAKVARVTDKMELRDLGFTSTLAPGDLRCGGSAGRSSTCS